MSDAKEALDVALDGSPEEACVDWLVSTNGSVGQVVNGLELGVQFSADFWVVELL